MLFQLGFLVRVRVRAGLRVRKLRYGVRVTVGVRLTSVRLIIELK